MDEFEPFDPESNADFDADDLDDDPEAPDLDDFDDEEDGDDLDSFAFADGEVDGFEGGELDEDFTVDAEYDDADGFEDEAETEPGGDETAYAATYEDLVLDEADNPPGFPPELDLDVPEPVDGYPWVDLDVLGHAEAEPWVNSVEASEYALADIDDPAAQALSRFWQG
ncbi:hypothetical protein K3N28_09170 [Glycomyces sp. TRM65418]|uniref:hypothetical protein n=1 Tax=Glycomyces sp. TRM65418 TaxID=2867006 RepID=UPI001CE6FC83|nr:hypothetical protein [Glycomyces sp. TRM65418]MCC3763240.1 hypothetical protein [Glycomyces sp. TRM65418]QZD57242.1 hypothetical protein K3N28_09110 [Glycomyces sp. TRM65418]